MKCTRCLKVEIPAENLISKNMMCDKCFAYVQKEYSHEAVMNRLLNTKHKKTTMKGRAGQSLFPTGF